MLVKLRDNEPQGIQINVQGQDKAQENRGRKASEKQQRKNTIFAGDLPLHKDSITLRRQQAQRKAMEFVKNAWNTDRKTDQSIDEIRALQKEQRKEAQRNWDQAQALAEKREGLREAYGVEPESQEQKDLELLMRAKSRYASREFTEEEKARLAELQDQPHTEYQERSLSLYMDQETFEHRAEQAEEYAGYLQGSITSINLERLKFHKMADAQANAKKVMDQASREIQGLLVDEAKDHVDETYEEQREEAEKKADEKEVQEEKIEVRREQKELMEARIEEAQQENRETEKAGKEQERDAREEAKLLKDMADAGLNVAGAGDAVKADIKDMLNKLKLIEADIKGIEVDEEI